MGAKYFKGRLYEGSRMMPYVVWDGEKEYRSEPPVERLMVVERLGGQLLVAQINNKRLNRGHLVKMLGGACDSLII
jgi:hypothetical protein